MRIDVLTLFPDMFASPLGFSIVKRAQDRQLVNIVLSNIRDFAKNSYKKVDDKPYGGGAGMVLMCQPVFDCIENVQKQDENPGRVILLTPGGKKFDQKLAQDFANEKRLILIAGHYEGFDERIRIGTNAEEVSIGDYVLSGGELAAMVIIDAVVRLLPGALGDDDSAACDSFSDGLLEYPHYTRPEVFRDMKVPDVLLSGNHKDIENWRKQQSLEKTKQQRPDLLK
ncbi:MAG: tRNA (guanosine(37)-N1)-methyltransferase TrmD [Planctomycetes bacterium GWF2_42_9]|nr:MAG: tRNA (guanosine(37)-N1)-methyltransferase TrmD [Planctomycetes bacterium GWF2_42_9]HAL46036.1 tRNA (guanosine(37)-N1)-methyltransferase TrmD [Phycisphaerales bacterium]